MQQITCDDEAQTKLFARRLAAILEKGDVLVLSGELGAGKTKFVEGLLSYYNLEHEISSPTFTIVNEYHNSSVDIYHFDLYRLKDIYEFENIGGEEYFSKGICIFEWGELIEDVLPNNYIKITFEKDDKNPDIRVLKVENFGNKYNEINFNNLLN